jgi:hypothetical protein
MLKHIWHQIRIKTSKCDEEQIFVEQQIIRVLAYFMFDVGLENVARCGLKMFEIFAWKTQNSLGKKQTKGIRQSSNYVLSNVEFLCRRFGVPQIRFML